MAIFNINNMLEFKNRIALAADGDVLNVTADLDYNTLPSEETRTPITLPAVHEIVVNGNGHALLNASLGVTGSTIFFNAGNGEITFNEMNFLNVNINRFPSYFLSSNSSGKITVNDCTFQGTFYGGVCCGSSNNTLNRCKLTLHNDVLNGDFSMVDYSTPSRWNECWIRLENCWIGYNQSQSKLLAHLDTCYVEGKVQFGTATSADSLRIVVGTYTNCCFNVELQNFDNQEKRLIDFFNRSTVPDKISIVNTDKIRFFTDSQDTRLVAVTDEQMKDAEYLASIGFNIVP